MKFPGMNFEKEGKGVLENNVRKASVSGFFSIVKRKFFAMIRLNLMHAVASIPAFAVAVILSYLLLKFDTVNIDADLAARILISFITVAFQLVAVGPLHAGFISVLRNYAREQEAFIWYDFWQGVKKNWKQSLAISVIDFIVMSIVCTMIYFYTQNSLIAGTQISSILLAVILLFVLLYAMMHIYIYPMIVSVNLTLKQIVSNALRFSVAKFFSNLGILAACLISSLIIFLNTIAGMFIMIFFGYALIGFIETYYAYYNIEKYIVKS